MKLFILCLVFLLSIGEIRAEEPTLEDKVKAAYILNFTRYTIWPSEVFSNANAPLVICVLSSDPFRKIMQKTVSGAKSVSRAIEIKQLKPPLESGGQCHVVFISHSYTDKESNLINFLKQKSVLSISDDESFFKSGGIISFVTFEETIQFNVNLGAADQAGLKLSSRMLSLAKNVVKEKKD